MMKIEISMLAHYLPSSILSVQYHQVFNLTNVACQCMGMLHTYSLQVGLRLQSKPLASQQSKVGFSIPLLKSIEILLISRRSKALIVKARVNNRSIVYSWLKVMRKFWLVKT